MSIQHEDNKPAFQIFLCTQLFLSLVCFDHIVLQHWYATNFVCGYWWAHIIDSRQCFIYYHWDCNRCSDKIKNKKIINCTKLTYTHTHTDTDSNTYMLVVVHCARIAFGLNNCYYCSDVQWIYVSMHSLFWVWLRARCVLYMCFDNIIHVSLCIIREISSRCTL